MDLSNSGLVILSLIITIITEYRASASDSDCPILCDCDYSRQKISCSYNDYITKLPHLPFAINYTRIHGGNFRTLTGPASCRSYLELIKLELINNRIISISTDAFQCMPRLQFLSIDSYELHTIQSEVFRWVPRLNTVLLSQNDLTVNVILSLCTAKNLKKLQLNGKKMILKPGSLECLRSLQHLSDVDLDNNFISGPVKDVLQPLTNLSNHLSVKNCNVSVLKNNTFTGFQMETLDLSYNKIVHIPKNTFVEMPNLKTLNLYQIGITTTREWLEQLSQIQVINLQINPLQELPPLARNIQQVRLGRAYLDKLATGSFSNLPNLHTISLTNSRITNIEPKAFYNLPNLKTVGLNGNEIKGISLTNLLSDLVGTPLQSLYLAKNSLHTLNKTFEVFTPNVLIDLYLYRCDIDRIMPNTFENFGELQILDLSRNKLERLDQSTFKGLTNLTTLQLANNNIQQLSPHTFESLTKLQSLGLSNNLLTEVDSKLTGLTSASMETLYLSSNRIKYISIKDISTLVTLEVSNNQIDYISAQRFSNLTTLHYLGLAANIIRNLDNDALLGLTNLAKLDLADNRVGMTRYLPGFLRQMSSLETLNLFGSSLGRLPSNEQKEIWEQMKDLSKLQINDCEIMMLFPGMFSNLHNLKELDASSNYIPFIEPLAFQNASRVIRLNFNRNLISYVKWASFIHLPNLQLLYLANNPLVCNCEVVWILQAIANPRSLYLLEQDRLVCKNPLDVQNVKLTELNLTVSHCEDHWIIIGKSTAVGLTMIFTMILLHIMWHYRWHIKYTLFLAKAGRGRYEELHDNHNYTYDAFVAYSSQDLPWVKDQLLSNIDAHYLGSEGFKLCVHDRDWLVGVDIAENIVKSIAESRRTILVLSKAFARSEWCQFELAMAHLRLNSEGYKKDRLLVILLDTIPAELLTPRIIYILASKTYLAWSEDHDSHPLFWKTLHRSLRRELLYKTASQSV